MPPPLLTPATPPTSGVDLAHIARTSYGIATSPPNGNAFSTSPVKTKGSLMVSAISDPPEEIGQLLIHLAQQK